MLAPLAQAQVTVRPDLCIYSPEQSACRGEFSFELISEQPESGCVYLVAKDWQQGERLPKQLVCWQQQSTALEVLELSIAPEQSFIYINELHQVSWLEVELLEQKMDRRLKRKRRHIWSFM